MSLYLAFSFSLASSLSPVTFPLVSFLVGAVSPSMTGSLAAGGGGDVHVFGIYTENFFEYIYIDISTLSVK